MILASLNPNLTIEDLRVLGEKRIEAMREMADVFVKGLERTEPEHRAQYICEMLPIFTQLWCQMMVW